MHQNLKTFKRSNQYLHFLILVGIIILTLIVYSGIFKFGFINWDDNTLITENEDIQNLTVSGIVKIFSSFYPNVYDPLRMLSYSFIYHFCGLNSTAFHSANLFFHLLNIILVYLFIYRLTSLQTTVQFLQSSNSRIQVSALVACLFAIHPMHTESICWLSALCDPQYAFFYLASLTCYIKYLQNSRLKIQKTRYYLISLFLFLLSLLSKSTAVTLPLVLFLLDYYNGSLKLEAGSLRYWIKKVPFFLLALAFGIIAIISERFTDISNDQLIQYSLFNRFFLLTYSISFYVIYILAPIKLSALHPSPEIIERFLPIKYYISPLLILLIIVVILKLKKLRKEIVFGVLFFLISISASIIASKVRPHQVADRYTYIPYLGLFFIISIFINQKTILKNQMLKGIIIIFFILYFSFISYNRTKVWANSLDLYNDIIEKYPRVYLAYENRGNAKYKLGDKQGALEDYDKAIEINPHSVIAYYNRGSAKQESDDNQGAIDDYSKAIVLNPYYIKAYNNRGISRSKIGEYQRAIQDYDIVIKINPQDADAYNNRGIAKCKLSEYQEALKDFDRAIEINPQIANSFNNRGLAKNGLEDIQGAIQDYDRAIELNPQYAIAYYERGLAKYKLNNKEGACSDWNMSVELGIHETYELITKYCKK
jgi:protein O-mannosyl-transferase